MDCLLQKGNQELSSGYMLCDATCNGLFTGTLLRKSSNTNVLYYDLSILFTAGAYESPPVAHMLLFTAMRLQYCDIEYYSIKWIIFCKKETRSYISNCCMLSQLSDSQQLQRMVYKQQVELH